MMTLEKRFEQNMIDIYMTAKKNVGITPAASFKCWGPWVD